MKLKLLQYNLFKDPNALLTPKHYRFVAKKDNVSEYWLFPVNYMVKLKYWISLRLRQLRHE